TLSAGQMRIGNPERPKMQRIALSLTIVNLALLGFTLTQIKHTTAQDAVPVLRAQAIELVDEDGQVRSRLNLEPGGEVVFRLLDQDGTIRVKLGAAREGSGLLLANDATEPGVHILADSTGSSLKLRNKDGAELKLAP
ncbi:MAG TPA: hypothetical protein VH835_10060, partial [Dongiaceae bacterium]